jgi:hypothetical protein
MSTDCHLSYETFGSGPPLDSLHFVQPRCLPTLYPSEFAASSITTTPSPAGVEDDYSATQASLPVVLPPSQEPLPGPISPPLDAQSPPDMLTLTSHLRTLVDQVLNSAPSDNHSAVTPSSTSDSSQLPQPPMPTLLSTMSCNEVMKHIHHGGSTPPAVCPWNTSYRSDTKLRWSLEELHRIMGCRKFQNYKHIIQVSRDGEWVNNGKFPPSLGSFATIPKARQGKPLNCTNYLYLDAVHMDIAVGDCLSIVSFWYALILVDRGSRYNWAFCLKELSSDNILEALRESCTVTGALAQCFYCDCEAELFGKAIRDYMIDNDSKVVAATPKCQSANG